MIYVVYYSDTGEAFSIGSVLAVPMPDEFSVYTCQGNEGAGLVDGTLMWDPASRTIVPRPEEVDG